jgi:hypothetical protein
LLVFDVFILIAVVLFIHIMFIARSWDVSVDCYCAICPYSVYCWFLGCLYGLPLCCLLMFCSVLAFEIFLWIAAVVFVYIVLIAGFSDGYLDCCCAICLYSVH